MFPKDEVVEAKKRISLKRFCAKHCIAYGINDATTVLRDRVRLYQHLLKDRPELLHVIADMTGEQVEEAAKGNHYVNNLVSMKIMFGQDSGIGCVMPTEESATHTVQCKTIADLVRIGWVNRKWLYLDAHLHKLRMLGSESPLPKRKQRV